MAMGAVGVDVEAIVGGMRGMMQKETNEREPDRDALTPAVLMERLEDFFSAPEFTCSVRAFVDEHDSTFVYVSEGEEQPLANYDVYLKYTRLIEGLLESFLESHGINQEDIAQLCQEEKESGNQTSFCLDYLLASTQYDWFVQMMYDFRSMQDYDGVELEGLDCLGFGAIEVDAASATRGGGEGEGEDI